MDTNNYKKYPKILNYIYGIQFYSENHVSILFIVSINIYNNWFPSFPKRLYLFAPFLRFGLFHPQTLIYDT